MPIDEKRRSELFRVMSEQLGEEPAITMFELLPPPGSDLATRDDLHGLEQRMELMEQRLDARIDGVEQRLDARIDGVEQQLATLRHELTAVFRAELGQVAAGHTRAMVAAMATTVVGIGGLGLAFAQLL